MAEDRGMSEIKQSAEDEVQEVARGRPWYTPFAVVGGVAVIVWVVAAVIIAAALVIRLAL
jgi:hypothetical protein